jgi:hypothetical protein
LKERYTILEAMVDSDDKKSRIRENIIMCIRVQQLILPIAISTSCRCVEKTNSYNRKICEKCDSPKS